MWPTESVGGRMPGMRIFHIATLADWKQAEESGTYAISTYGRTLEDEGFIHAAYHDQVRHVRDGRYAEVTEPLVVLEIETELLDAAVTHDQADGGPRPHIHGPITTGAVVAWRPARFAPIDLGGTNRPAPTPLPMTTVAFRGLALVLAAATGTALVCAVIAQSRTDDAELPEGVAFLLWSLVVILAVPSLAALTYGEWARLRARWED